MATEAATDSEPEAWRPAKIWRVIEVLETSTTPIIVETDAGNAYVKVLGNPEGPTALACEWLGTRLAGWLGLRTFEMAIVDYPKELQFDLPKGCRTEAGPALATKAVSGRPWSGTAGDLDLIENQDDIAGIVVLDTWLRNTDRFFPSCRPNARNVFLSAEGAPRGRRLLLAIDHTACIRQGRELSRKQHLRIEEERDNQTYGLFPEFIPHVSRRRVVRFLNRLRAFTRPVVEQITRQIPPVWISTSLRDDLVGFCVGRAQHVASHLEQWLEDPCAWHPELPLESETYS